MIASESTALTLDRTERVFLQRSVGSARQLRSDHAGWRSEFEVIVTGQRSHASPRTPLISIQRIQKKQPTAPRHHATHN